MPSGLLVLGFAVALGAGLLLTSAIRNRSFSEVLAGVTSQAPEEVNTTEGGRPLVPGSKLLPGSGGSAADQKTFGRELAKDLGLAPSVVESWLLHEQPEGSSAEGGNNWLNVETGPRGGSGVGSAEAQYVNGLSPASAAAYTAQWIRENQPAIARAAGSSPLAQAEAIMNSGFAASKYGGETALQFLETHFR